MVTDSNLINRAKAIKAGYLIDMSDVGISVGLKVPSAITYSLWSALCEGNDLVSDQLRNRIMRALAETFMRCTVTRDRLEETSVTFEIQRPWMPAKHMLNTGGFILLVRAVIGPDDDKNPALTFMRNI